LTCTTLGLTAAATLATGSSSGIPVGEGASSLGACVAAALSLDPDLSPEQPASRAAIATAASKKGQRVLVLGFKTLRTSRGRPPDPGALFVTESIRKKRMVRFYTFPARAAVRELPSREKGPGLDREGDEMPSADEKFSRAGFLKLGVLGISATALAFAAGCGGEEDD
jgi:hypothetical protein